MVMMKLKRSNQKAIVKKVLRNTPPLCRGLVDPEKSVVSNEKIANFRSAFYGTSNSIFIIFMSNLYRN